MLNRKTSISKLRSDLMKSNARARKVGVRSDSSRLTQEFGGFNVPKKGMRFIKND